MSERRWGKAGQRLSEAEARARDSRRRLDAWKSERAVIREEGLGHTEWERGLLSPERITMALDAKGLDGPEVDEQCGAHEPEVDQWEAGTLYPTWEQTKALANLCGVTPRFLMWNDGIDPKRLRPSETSMRFHVDLPDDPAPIERFPESVVQTRVSPSDAGSVADLYAETLF